jgi:hypothetical protein
VRNGGSQGVHAAPGFPVLTSLLPEAHILQVRHAHVSDFLRKRAVVATGGVHQANRRLRADTHDCQRVGGSDWVQCERRIHRDGLSRAGETASTRYVQSSPRYFHGSPAMLCVVCSIALQIRLVLRFLARFLRHGRSLGQFRHARFMLRRKNKHCRDLEECALQPSSHKCPPASTQTPALPCPLASSAHCSPRNCCMRTLYTWHGVPAPPERTITHVYSRHFLRLLPQA